MPRKLLAGNLIILALLNAQGSIVNQFSQAFADAAEKAKPAVVTIMTDKVYKVKENTFPAPFNEFFKYHFFPRNLPEQEFHGQTLGSGVIVDAEKGYILTNNHVIADADKIKIMLIDKRVFTAEIIGSDPKSDLSLLKIKAGDLTALELGDSDKLRVGEWVLAVGSPFSVNLSHSVTAGIVSALGRSDIIPGADDYEDFIQTDAAINPGNSGGALLNLNGDLIGINTAIATGGFERSNRGVGFAIPANMARKVMNDLLQHGYVVRSWLGVYIQPIEENYARALNLKTREGALISEVVKDSPAEKGGLKVGDVILKFDGVRISDPANLKNVVSSKVPGTRSTVDIIRDGERREIVVKLDELPQDDTRLLTSRKSSRTDELGLRVEELTSLLADQYGVDRDLEGVIITQVQRGSPADRAGLRPGDVVLRIGSQDVKSIKDFQKLVKPDKDDEAVLFLIKRDNVSRFYAVELK